MSCCGNKRKEWMNENEVKSSTNQNLAENNYHSVINDKPDRIFVYTGSSSLRINGVSGKSYNFKFKGDQLKVDNIDSFAMMAERDLDVLPLKLKEN
jgi:hypothetical protein